MRKRNASDVCCYYHIRAYVRGGPRIVALRPIHGKWFWYFHCVSNSDVPDIRFRLAGYPTIFTIPFRARPNFWAAAYIVTGFITVSIAALKHNCHKIRLAPRGAQPQLKNWGRPRFGLQYRRGVKDRAGCWVREGVAPSHCEGPGVSPPGNFWKLGC